MFWKAIIIGVIICRLSHHVPKPRGVLLVRFCGMFSVGLSWLVRTQVMPISVRKFGLSLYVQSQSDSSFGVFFDVIRDE